MKFTIVFSTIIILFTSCKNSTNQNSETTSDSRELIPEPDKRERLRYEAIEKLKKSGCEFVLPDTSLSGIILRDPKSASKLIGENKIDSLGQHHFYSNLERETIILTQLPGDGENQISIFKVFYSDKADYGYQQLSIDTLKTEKGIKLGLSKNQLIEKLGTCCAAIDSSKDYIELYYMIELPNDSKTKFLARQNMPVYFASYKFWNDKLEAFEFGFENP